MTGRLLDLRFAEKELRGERRVVHVDVTGDLPGSLAEWRVGPTTEPAERSLARMPGLNVSAQAPSLLCSQSRSEAHSSARSAISKISVPDMIVNRNAHRIPTLGVKPIR